jgi:3-methyladenine DNA glycosylase AlkD
MRHAEDERIYVKKAGNWALRNVGKRNVDLNTQAFAAAKRILAKDSSGAKWIANNALNELAKLVGADDSEYCSTQNEHVLLCLV